MSVQRLANRLRANDPAARLVAAIELEEVARTTRNDAIREAAAAGVPVMQLAALSGLSKQAVYNVIQRPRTT